jgi:ABC-type polysaccharide/polyol phosphate export permease
LEISRDTNEKRRLIDAANREGRRVKVTDDPGRPVATHTARRAGVDSAPSLANRLRLVLGFARRDILTRYAGSYLGIVWAFAVPLLSSAVYILVFGTLMQGSLLGERYRGIDFLTFYLIAFAPWMLFTEVVARAPGIVRENGNLIRNVRFEHRLLPYAIFLSATIAHVILLALSVALIVGKGYEFSSRIYMLPIYFVLLFLLTTGVAYLLAALSPYLPDIGQIVPIFLNLYFFACPIVYTPDLVEKIGSPIAKLFLVQLNPMAGIIDGYRLSLLHVQEPVTASGLGMLTVLCLATFVVGILVYRHLERGFADVL